MFAEDKFFSAPPFTRHILISNRPAKRSLAQENHTAQIAALVAPYPGYNILFNKLLDHASNLHKNR